MKKAQYKVVNANGSLIQTFGSDFQSANKFARENNRCGLMYGLRAVRYYVTA